MNCFDLVNLIGGDLINPNESVVISGVAKPELSTQTDVVFIFDSKTDVSKIASKLIVTKSKLELNTTQIINANPRLAMAKTLQFFIDSKACQPHPDISDHAVINPSAKVDNTALIEPFVVVDSNSIIEKNVTIKSGVKIGKNCVISEGVTIYSNTTLYDNCFVGRNSIIHSNTIIGSDGFGYENDSQKWVKIPHIAGVKIGENVEIGSLTTINRGCLSDTVICDGVKIDDHNHIAHNCCINENTVIAGGSLIGGSSIIGKNCILAGNVDVKENISIGDNTIVFARSGVTKSVPKNSKVSGFPAQDHRQEIKYHSFLKRLFRSKN